MTPDNAPDPATSRRRVVSVYSPSREEWMPSCGTACHCLKVSECWRPERLQADQ